MAEARSDETFVALSLLTVTGASLLTQKLGFSDTMGAFVAGVLLAETNYSTQARHCCSSFLTHALFLDIRTVEVPLYGMISSGGPLVMVWSAVWEWAVPGGVQHIY